MFTIVACGTAGVSNSFETYVGQSTLSALTALLATADLVLDLRAKAELHGKLKFSYFELLAKVEESLTLTDENSAKLQAEKIRLTATEPSEFRAVDAIAHNEAVDALGRDEQFRVRLPIWRRMLAHFVPFRGYTFEYASSTKPAYPQRNEP